LFHLTPKLTKLAEVTQTSNPHWENSEIHTAMLDSSPSSPQHHGLTPIFTGLIMPSKKLKLKKSKTPAPEKRFTTFSLILMSSDKKEPGKKKLKAKLGLRLRAQIKVKPKSDQKIIKSNMVMQTKLSQFAPKPPSIHPPDDFIPSSHIQSVRNNVTSRSMCPILPTPRRRHRILKCATKIIKYADSSLANHYQEVSTRKLFNRRYTIEQDSTKSKRFIDSPSGPFEKYKSRNRLNSSNSNDKSTMTANIIGKPLLKNINKSMIVNSREKNVLIQQIMLFDDYKNSKETKIIDVNTPTIDHTRPQTHLESKHRYRNYEEYNSVENIKKTQTNIKLAKICDLLEKFNKK